MPAYLLSNSWSLGMTRAISSGLSVRDAMAARSQQSPAVTNRCITDKCINNVQKPHTTSHR